MLHVYNAAIPTAIAVGITVRGSAVLQPRQIRELLRVLGDSSIGHLIELHWPGGARVTRASETLGRRAISEIATIALEKEKEHVESH
jgi:hypothetical protein